MSATFCRLDPSVLDQLCFATHKMAAHTKKLECSSEFYPGCRLKLWSISGLLQRALKVCCNVSEASAASSFMVTESSQVDAEVVGRNICVRYMGRTENILAN